MKLLKGRDLNGRTLEQWFKKRKHRDFEDLKANYVARYNALEDFLKNDVHPLVAVGAAVQKDHPFLNDHGPAHVATVIQRASSLISTESCRITAYEAYLLLAAIQLHDIGNILGRSGHEARLPELKGRLDGLLGDDTPEKRLVMNIAEAHGGSHDGDKDTIRHIIDEPVLNQTVDAKFLAGLLRFADELADDSQRVSAFAIDNDAIPDSSRLYHKYSSSLQSVKVDNRGKAIDLYFDIYSADAEEEFQIDGTKRFLIEEIMRRSVKMHRERIYCMRFLRPRIQIDSISVKINIYRSKKSSEKLSSIGYRLEDHGYPSVPEQAIYELCPELRTWHEGEPLNGTSLLAHIAEKTKHEHK